MLSMTMCFEIFIKDHDSIMSPTFRIQQQCLVYNPIRIPNGIYFSIQTFAASRFILLFQFCNGFQGLTFYHICVSHLTYLIIENNQFSFSFFATMPTKQYLHRFGRHCSAARCQLVIESIVSFIFHCIYKCSPSHEKVSISVQKNMA